MDLKTGTCKLVYPCRNPKDNFVSLWHFVNKMKPEEKGQTTLPHCLDNFCRGLSPCGPFWEHVLGYHKASSETPEEVLFPKYEDMKEDPCAHLRRLAGFLDALEVDESGKLASGEENKAFFRRGEVGDWANYLSSEMVDRTDRVVEEKLCGSGLRL
ncbi:hypothetical protein EUGRSUZ_H02684 [Eucalyptus grandis]|uniref:Uncharacterized protein n=2 Tax=Eucalyptus grandis TaxID=71139 RepID=A0ACC3JSE9_EUCGR|nr:hypothetical protein EUGRSUZ_H02684 [Eucalyptus grandis]